MMKRKGVVLLCVVCLLFWGGLAFADEQSDSNTIFDWAEANYPQYLSTTSPSQSFFIQGYYVRYYDKSNTYLGTRDGTIYAYGSPFGGLLEVGSVSSYLDLVSSASSGWEEGLVGSWSVVEKIDGNSCGDGTYEVSYVAVSSVSGDQLSVSAQGITRSGTISGNSVSYSVSYPEDGGTTTAKGTLTFSSDSVNGTSTWSWSNGSRSCSGTSIATGSRL